MKKFTVQLNEYGIMPISFQRAAWLLAYQYKRVKNGGKIYPCTFNGQKYTLVWNGTYWYIKEGHRDFYGLP